MASARYSTLARSRPTATNAASSHFGAPRIKAQRLQIGLALVLDVVQRFGVSLSADRGCLPLEHPVVIEDDGHASAGDLKVPAVIGRIVHGAYHQMAISSAMPPIIQAAASTQAA